MQLSKRELELLLVMVIHYGETAKHTNWYKEYDELKVKIANEVGIIILKEKE